MRLILAGLVALMALFATPEPAAADEYFNPTIKLLNYSFGEGETNSCAMCDVAGYTMLAVANLSKSGYLYFFSFFKILAPTMMLTWLGYRAAKLMTTGGEDGRSFMYLVVSKFALFTMIWLFMLAATGGRTYESVAWNTVGPTYLNYAFELAADLREASVAGATYDPVYDNTTADSEDFACREVVPTATNAAGAMRSSMTRYSFIAPALELVCTTERIHLIGIATGVAMLTSSITGMDLSFWEIGDSARDLVVALVKVLTAGVILVIYALSAIWLAFLVLDVVARGLITALFAPVFAMAALFQPTRGIAVKAIRALAGAAVSVAALAIAGVLSTFLMTTTVLIYNETYTMVAQDGLIMEAVPTTNVLESYRVFIERVAETRPGRPVIPVDFGTPWFYYLLLVGVVTLALTKKIIGMMEALLGEQAAAVFADTAQRTFEKASSGSVRMASLLVNLKNAASLSKLAGGGLVAAGTAINPFGGGGSGGSGPAPEPMSEPAPAPAPGLKPIPRAPGTIFGPR